MKPEQKKTIQLNTEIATKTPNKKEDIMKIMKILNYVVGQASECKNINKNKII